MGSTSKSGTNDADSEDEDADEEDDYDAAAAKHYQSEWPAGTDSGEDVLVYIVYQKPQVAADSGSKCCIHSQRSR